MAASCYSIDTATQQQLNQGNNMFAKTTAPARRTTVDIDTRRNIVVIARSRKPKEVAEVSHEQFIRNALKDKMGWPRREPAPESIKAAAREMASFLVARDKEIAAAQAKARDEQAAKDAAVAQGIADNV
jgi:hypothetical protein